MKAITVFVAMDGKRFDNEAVCLAYEGMLLDYLTALQRLTGDVRPKEFDEFVQLPKGTRSLLQRTIEYRRSDPLVSLANDPWLMATRRLDCIDAFDREWYRSTKYVSTTRDFDARCIHVHTVPAQPDTPQPNPAHGSEPAARTAATE